MDQQELDDTREAIRETKRALKKLKALESDLAASVAAGDWLSQSSKRSAAKRASLDASKALSKFRRRR